MVMNGGKENPPSPITILKKLNLKKKTKLFPIEKKLEEIFRPGDSIPLYIDKKSETLRMIQRLRDEAHRFGIEHHRARRTKGVVKTGLTEIKGIGEKISEKLLKKFRSVQKIKEASLDDLSEIIGQ